MTAISKGIKRKYSHLLAQIPREIVIHTFVEKRAREVEALSSEVDCTDGKKKVSQRLPRNMRRRAMSHDIKRLPQRFRDLVKQEYANQGAIKKVPSRKHRRRPRNLLDEYNRRQGKQIWLETHIWHAKRFHMAERWGFKLPLKSTRKSGRATYRATTQYCLLQDMSYLCCIELKGEEGRLLSHLSHLTSSGIGPTFAARMCKPGTREGHVMLYQLDSYPRNAIGPVTFLWKPVQQDSGVRTLWIWCHCCCLDEVWNQLLKCFNLKNDEKEVESESSNHSATETRTNNKGEEAHGTDNSGGKASAVRKYLFGLKAKDENVSMTSLAGSLQRFRLTGPMANAVLVDCLQQANIVPGKVSGTQTAENSDLWWKDYFADLGMSLGHTHQREMMEHVSHCQSPAELPPHCVLGMTVRDPRVTRPQSRNKVATNSEPEPWESRLQGQITPDVSMSAIWEAEVREEVKKTKLSDYRLNLLKSEQLVPGTSIDLGDSESRIPVLLIQQPGIVGGEASYSPSQSLTGYSSGWDLVLPEGWGMPFWLSLVFREARTGGLFDTEKIADEGKALLFPNDFPDTKSGEKLDLNIGKDLLEKYQRKPPAKRPNFVKLGVASPFSCPWQKLVHCQPSEKPLTKISPSDKSAIPETEKMEVQPSDAGPGSSFYVLRDRKALRQLHAVVKREAISRRTKQRPNLNSSEDQTCTVLKQLSSEHGEGLVAVSVELLSKGNPVKFAMVCVPSTEDLEMLMKEKSYGGPLEPVHEDPVKKQMRDQKKLVKAGLLKKPEKIKRPDPSISCDILDEAFTGFSSRPVIGYLTGAGALLTDRNEGGKGFCSVHGLCRLLQNTLSQPQTLVLLRNPTSLQYRFAKLSLVQT